MKQMFVTLLFVLVPNISDAQYSSNLKMNVDGNFTTQDGKDYDVAVFEGKNSIELFDKVKKNVALIYRSPKDIESNVDDKIISIYAYASNCVRFNWGISPFILSFHYSLKFQFKDDKIRIEVPILSEMEGAYYYTSLHELFIAASIFKKNGSLSEKPKKRQVVIDFEEYFNNLINRIINGDSKSNDDW